MRSIIYGTVLRHKKIAKENLFRVSFLKILMTCNKKLIAFNKEFNLVIWSLFFEFNNHDNA